MIFLGGVACLLGGCLRFYDFWYFVKNIRKAIPSHSLSGNQEDTYRPSFMLGPDNPLTIYTASNWQFLFFLSFYAIFIRTLSQNKEIGLILNGLPKLQNFSDYQRRYSFYVSKMLTSLMLEKSNV
ncbi:unnamed protein product [Ceratitis capitata]|uniref:(Mediterranean fruit fly) hypothetical protein n=1 Tax=Ceratitis capitata TaxID=7213 RepID=A0A811V594_CERCA|nr:unnamed protein product [Ceratitis capitata]